MYSLSSLPHTEPRTPNKEGERPTDQRKARLFQDLLDALPDPRTAAVALSAQLMSSNLPSIDVDESAKVPSAQPIPPADSNVGARHPLPAIDGQTLTLRASTGPLAGLLVQAEWRNQRLSLRLSAPDGSLATRLERQQRALQTALSAALGVEVVIEVQHAS